MNPRTVLGVGPDAGPDEIRSAFRKQAGLLHPDRNPGDKEAARRYQEVTRAYEALSRGPEGVLHGAAAPPAPSPIDAVSSIVEGILGGILGLTKPAQTLPDNLTLDLYLDWVQLARGAQVEFEIPQESRCARCQGSGAGEGTCAHCLGQGATSQTLWSVFGVSSTCWVCQGDGKERCSPCGGTGVERRLERVVFSVPAGIRPGYRLRFAGYGPLNPRIGLRGDLLLQVHLRT